MLHTVITHFQHKLISSHRITQSQRRPMQSNEILWAACLSRLTLSIVLKH